MPCALSNSLITYICVDCSAVGEVLLFWGGGREHAAIPSVLLRFLSLLFPLGPMYVYSWGKKRRQQYLSAFSCGKVFCICSIYGEEIIANHYPDISRLILAVEISINTYRRRGKRDERHRYDRSANICNWSPGGVHNLYTDPSVPSLDPSVKAFLYTSK